MASPSPAWPASLSAPLTRLLADLQEIFGTRLSALVAHGPRVRHPQPGPGPALPISTLALVKALEYKDLAACAQRARDWRADSVSIPLLLDPREFERSLDAFPLEYGDIVAHHIVVFGDDPFAGLSVRDEDLRRACEAWGKAHLIHLREGFIEAGGDARAVAALVVASAAPFSGLMAHIARLRASRESHADARADTFADIPGLSPQVVAQVTALEARPVLDADTAMALYPAYLDAVDALVRFLDGWADA